MAENEKRCPPKMMSFLQLAAEKKTSFLAGVSACTVGTSFIFTKKSSVAKCFFDICNAEMAQSLSSLQKSEFLKLIILIFRVKNLNN